MALDSDDTRENIGNGQMAADTRLKQPLSSEQISVTCPKSGPLRGVIANGVATPLTWHQATTTTTISLPCIYKRAAADSTMGMRV